MKFKFMGTFLSGITLISVCFGNGSTYLPPSHKHGTKLIREVPSSGVMPGTNIISARIYPGSLKSNVLRLVRPYGWTVVWNVHYDFDFVGSTVIRASSIESVLQTLLQNYPLQAIFFRGNHVIEIRSRAL